MKNQLRSKCLYIIAFLSGLVSCKGNQQEGEQKPNFIVVYTDDQRFDALGYVNSQVISPVLDSLCRSGVFFKNACVSTSICSPSRAAMLTGRYGSANGVTGIDNPLLRDNEIPLPMLLKNEGYTTAMIGKWHLNNSPESLGFDVSAYFRSNGKWYDRKAFDKSGKEIIAKGFIEDHNAREALRFMDQASKSNQAFFLFYCPQLVHLDNDYNWDVRDSTLARYAQTEVQTPANWQDDLSGKPLYLKNQRHRTRAIEYGYTNADTLIRETKKYYAAVTELDASLRPIFEKLRKSGLDKNTYVIVMGDNGWFLGDHLFTSKVLAYEESLRVPLIICGPGIKHQDSEKLVMNIDLMPTILELADIPPQGRVHGMSLVPLISGKKRENKWRDHIYYEAPISQLGSKPLFAIRTERWKYIETYIDKNDSTKIFQELYDLGQDPYELHNVTEENQDKAQIFSDMIERSRDNYENSPSEAAN